MKRNLLAISILASMASMSCAQTTKNNFNSVWCFSESDGEYSNLSTFNGAQWKVVNLPHDWDIYHAPSAKAPTGGGTVSVKGQATLLAAASSDLRDLEPKVSPNVKTFKGRAIIVVRSGKKAGKAIVNAASDDAKIKGQVIVNVK